jgi:hypothetical protein
MRTLPTYAAVAVLLLAGPALAQDASLTPANGAIALSASSLSEPHTLSVAVGGDTDASTLSSGCAGQITPAATTHLNFTAGQAPLTIRASSANVPGLMVVTPDGSLFCAVSDNGANPTLRFGAPQSGRYAIWVASESGVTSAQLTFSGE